MSIPYPLDPQAREEVDALLNAALPVAETRLQQRRAFLPFASWLTEDGSMESVAGATNPRADQAAVIAELQASMRAKLASGEARAACVCADVRVRLPGTKIVGRAGCAMLLHATGASVNAYLPYTRKLFRGVRTGEVFAGPGTFLLEAPPSSPSPER